jgi:hypothetical protein
MPNSFAFGTSGNLDIITTSTYCGAPEDGEWFVALTSGGTDAFSLQLSSPLIVGQSYSLIFYDRTCSGWPAGSPIKIGVSSVNYSFGSLVYTAPTPVNDSGWTQRTCTFISPISALYITVTCDGVTSTAPWTQVDNFSFQSKTSLETLYRSNSIHIFPNPTSSEINIDLGTAGFKAKAVKVSNQFGLEFFESEYTGKIDVSKLPNGFYVLELLTDDNYRLTKFFIKTNH